MREQMADFDVLCLQEVAINYPRLDGDASQDQPQQLRELLPGFEVFFGAAVDELAPRRQIAATLRQPDRHPSAGGAGASLHLPYPADADAGGVRSMPAHLRVGDGADADLGPVRFMTTHLSFTRPRCVWRKARELLRLHAQGCALAAHPPLLDDTGSPFQSKPHTAHCILTGDFNFEPDSDEYALLQTPQAGASRLVDAGGRLCASRAPRRHAPTFRLHDRRYGPEPITCDFLFVSDGLAPRVRRVDVDLVTRRRITSRCCLILRPSAVSCRRDAWIRPIRLGRLRCCRACAIVYVARAG